MRAFMLYSASASLEALSPKLTPWKFALEGSFSVVIQYIGTVLMELSVVGFAIGIGLIAKLLVEDLSEAL